MEKFFKLKENGTSVSTEIMAGLTTFFAMSYILFVNPSILSASGMPSKAVFLATIIAAAISTLIMGLFANVPYALAPGMGLNAFFTYTVVFGLGFSWQEALAMVFICGLFNVFITVTKFRKSIIKAIPVSLQHAIGGGIGVFVAYLGFKNANIITFSASAANIVTVNGVEPAKATAKTFADGVFSINANGGVVPAISTFTDPSVLLAIFGLLLTAVLVIRNVRGAILIGIVATTLAGIPMGVVDLSTLNFDGNHIGSAFSELGTTFLAAFGGMQSLFSDSSRLPLVLMTIFAFSLSDTFDTIGTFIGTGRRTGIFSQEDENALENSTGFSSKMDRALFADAIGTSIGALFGTSNTTTYVESAAGIAEGGRTGLTAVSTAVCFLLSTLLLPLVGIVPAAATAPALIIVGVMMVSSFLDVDWSRFEDALPAFFAAFFMALCYSISYGIAAAFIFYCLVKIVKGEANKIHPILWGSTFLFILNFIILAIL
ncbi:NCS2 family permease [Streptococcus dysgalactiae subsp. equisimilis]|uniref:NCS2 family permease n=1 Tax=Streptococcus dysgalactiae subsp. dysgalactiae TaxID=99822 RepID=A0A9X7X989_STRDY|nr:NCS2 family permease [Streptococcus dysgalactiae]MCL6222142.1 NCS2 family permease [Streptococcus dysgalactiae subsp. equisimilis]MDY4033723.1 NCS2 family permease [Streptococcus dysgalactiae]MSU86142.1 NCS2 family permease [Streptococcus dysgalactiae subsp. dysgalactiae]QGG98345.1 NCS2 family permease [Streptococcus dysgalactiae subsp. dysgalactiae]QGH02627.1 NCS2 family permease [Streptococcus dysgalactiae subsp. dysgalactiae]